MFLYEKYILKLLFSRFSVILFCTSLFGIFQELTKGTLLIMCTFTQMLTILPLLLPMLIFQFYPFVYFIVLLLVLNEIYNGNELVCFKSIGVSYKKLVLIFFYFACFVLLFFVFLAFLYPKTNELFYRKRNEFGAINILKQLQPNKLNKLGKYQVFFTDIDRNKNLRNITIIKNEKDKSIKEEIYEKKKIINMDSMLLGYNNYGEMIARCKNVRIATIDLRDNGNKKDDNVYNKSIVNAEDMDVLFDSFFKARNNGEIHFKQRIRQTGIAKLIKMKNRKKQQKWYLDMLNIEIQGRIVVYWFIIIGITFICCLMLLKQTNRIPNKKITSIVVLAGGYIALNRAFILEGCVKKGLLFPYYLHLFLIGAIFLFYILSKDKRKTEL